MSLMHRYLNDKAEWYELCLQRRALELGYSHIKPSIVSILKHMQRGAPSRIALLAQRAGTTRRRVSQVVAEGVEAGILELVDDPDDKRVSLVTLSVAGQAMCDADITSMHAVEAELARRIGRANLQKLTELLAMDWGPAEVAADTASAPAVQAKAKATPQPRTRRTASPSTAARAAAAPPRG